MRGRKTRWHPKQQEDEMNKYKFLLNMQNFAEGIQPDTQGNPAAGNGGDGNGTAQIDYAKLADIVENALRQRKMPP